MTEEEQELIEAISHVSEDLYSAKWGVGCEVAIWDHLVEFVQDPSDSVLRSTDAYHLLSIVLTTGKWVKSQTEIVSVSEFLEYRRS